MRSSSSPSVRRAQTTRSTTSRAAFAAASASGVDSGIVIVGTPFSCVGAGPFTDGAGRFLWCASACGQFQLLRPESRLLGARLGAQVLRRPLGVGVPVDNFASSASDSPSRMRGLREVRPSRATRPQATARRERPSVSIPAYRRRFFAVGVGVGIGVSGSPASPQMNKARPRCGSTSPRSSTRAARLHFGHVMACIRLPRLRLTRSAWPAPCLDTRSRRRREEQERGTTSGEPSARRPVCRSP